MEQRRNGRAGFSLCAPLASRLAARPGATTIRPMTSTHERATLSHDKIAAKAAAKIAGFHANVVEEVRRAIADSPVVVVGMAQNPHVKRVRRALEGAGVDYRYLEYGSYLSQWHARLAIKLWSGWPTFPQVFVAGTLIGGEDLTKAALADGSLQSMLESRA